MDDRTNNSIKAVKVSIAGNVFLALLKLTLGIFAHSIALISDGLDTAVDIVKVFVVFRGINIAAKPADNLHPYGHGRAETIASSIIGVSVIFAGLLIIIQSIQSFGKTNAMDTLMFIGAGASIAGKVFLSKYMMTVGKKLSNQAITANAKDYLGDVFSSTAVVISALLIRLTGRKYFDSIASIVVALIIIYMGYKIIEGGAKEMMEEQDNPEIMEKVENIVNECTNAKNPHLIRMRRLGSYYIVDMHIEFPENMSVKESHNIVNSLEHRIREQLPEVQEVVIHIEPIGNG